MFIFYLFFLFINVDKLFTNVKDVYMYKLHLWRTKGEKWKRNHEYPLDTNNLIAIDSLSFIQSLP